MTKGTRNLVLGLCGVMIVGSLVAFAATGAEPFTKFPDEELSAQDAASEDGFADLFGDEELPSAPNKFAFGFLPSGPGKWSLSVASVSGPAVAIGVIVVFLSRKKSKGGTGEDIAGA